MFCVIPARKGSKRLAQKNLLPLLGKPMLAYSIEAALDSGCFDTVYVATEDEEIAQVARTYGATVPFIVPAELCGDMIASHVPCTYMIEKAMDAGKKGDAFCCLQPSSPLRTPPDIKKAVEAFKSGDYDFLVSVTPIDPHYFHWGLEKGTDEYWKMYFGDKFMKERPLLPAIVRPNGSIKIARLDALSKTGNFFGSKLGTIETPEERSVHVATRYDFEICEFLLGKKPSVQLNQVRGNERKRA